jgi:hypothetical protein
LGPTPKGEAAGFSDFCSQINKTPNIELVPKWCKAFGNVYKSVSFAHKMLCCGAAMFDVIQ